MPERVYSIAGEIFTRFPGYMRGVVLGFDVTNGPSPDELVGLQRDAEASLRTRLSADAVAEHPHIKAWREAYRAFGAKPSEYRSSVEAMARRVVRGESIPSINALVDVGNVVSLRHLVNAGGHAIDVVAGDIALRPATGQEEFVPFGSDQIEHPLPGEVIFAEGNTVLTRRWTWRQANHTLTLPETRAIEYNIDGLPPVSAEIVEGICAEVMELIARFCGGRLRYEILSQEHPRMKLAEADE